jgi:hypothetical protein
MLSAQTAKQAGGKMHFGLEPSVPKSVVTYRKPFTMDNMFPIWLLPLWIVGAPLLALVADHLLSSSTTRTHDNATRPL